MTLTYTVVLLSVLTVGVLVGWYGRGLRLRYAKPKLIRLDMSKHGDEAAAAMAKLMRSYFDDEGKRQP